MDSQDVSENLLVIIQQLFNEQAINSEQRNWLKGTHFLSNSYANMFAQIWSSMMM